MTQRIVLDPGHGGDATADGLTDRARRKRTGAVVPGLVEADYAVSLARHVGAVMRHSCEPFSSYFTRTRNDEAISLAERGERSREFAAGLVVSLHVNAHTSPKLRGALLFHWPDDPIGEKVSRAISRAMPEPLRRESSAVWAATDHPEPGDDWLQRPRNVLEPHVDHSTAVLLEVGYCTNPTDLAALLDGPTQSAIVAAIMVGAACYRQARESNL